MERAVVTAYYSFAKIAILKKNNMKNHENIYYICK